MSVNERSPRHHVVDEPVAVDVFERRACRPPDEQRRAANGLERPHRAIDAAGKDADGAGEQLPGLNGSFHRRRAASRA
jgi:hypothetical protein